ncbi:MAG: flagellar export protein FliJ [Acetatifactor sp.]|nr:flagellar export protein FliJ [Acetatifactor sp.]MDE6699508.1 flagellar export protein FliJ [Acetatifactor sp.]MDE7113754.1 flagellar export protein FliJ [Acetatifactor sp.]
MAKFRYRLQNVLNIKLKMEDMAKQEFSTAKMLLDEEEEKLFGLQARKREYEELARTLLNGVLNVREIETNQNAILTMDGYIAEQHVQVENARRKLENARERMKVAMQERKTQETLREKAFDEFVRELNREESKVIDELTSYTYGQKQEV